MTLIQRFRDYTATRRSRATVVKRMTSVHRLLLKLIANKNSAKAGELGLALYELTGDSLDAARAAYLRSCVTEVEQVQGNILLSSVSLMTLIVGAVSGGDKRRTIWTLEQDQHASTLMRAWLTRYNIRRTYVVNAPPVVKGGMVHYRVDPAHLPKNISLVMCERTNAAPGAALSTLLSVAPNLALEFTVFARRISMDEDGRLLKRWAVRHGATLSVINARDGFIKISRRTAQPATGRATFDGTLEDVA